MNAPLTPATAQPPANSSDTIDITPLRVAAAWVTGRYFESLREQVAALEWVWEAIQGDFNDQRSTGQIAFDTVISMIPLVDQLCDLRDLVANCRKIEQDDSNSEAWFGLALCLIGLVPVLGSLLKGVLKIFFLYVRRLGVRGVDAAMGAVIALLNKYEVQRYLGRLGWGEPFTELAKSARALSARIDLAILLSALDRGAALLKQLRDNARIIPGLTERASALVALVGRVRAKAEAPLARAVAPLQQLLEQIAQRLTREHALYRRAIHNADNVHFYGGLPEAVAVQLMREKHADVSWLSKGATPVKYPSLKPGKVQDKLDDNKGWPSLSEGNIASFHTLEAATLRGPLRLYRIVGPNSRAMSDCWVSEKVFQDLMQAPDPKSAWRRHLAVWPHWNSDGQFVVMEIPAGHELRAWRGTTAGQSIKDFDAHLEGGWEQIFIAGSPNEHTRVIDTRNAAQVRAADPARNPRPRVLSEQQDQMETYERLAGGKLRGPLSAAEADALPKDSKIWLRAEIHHPNIAGPYDTRWGTTDFEPQLQDARLGLPNLPGQRTSTPTDRPIPQETPA